MKFFAAWPGIWRPAMAWGLLGSHTHQAASSASSYSGYLSSGWKISSHLALHPGLSLIWASNRRHWLQARSSPFKMTACYPVSSNLCACSGAARAAQLRSLSSGNAHYQSLETRWRLAWKAGWVEIASLTHREQLFEALMIPWCSYLIVDRSPSL